MAKIKIVHIVSSFGTGGLEKGIATLISHGSSAFDHSIICLTRSGASAKLLPENTTILEMNKPPGNSLPFIMKLARVLRSLKPDIVHTRNWSALDGILAARIANIPKVVHGEHGWGISDLAGRNLKRVIIRRILSILVREYICVSKDMIGWLQDTIKIRKPITQIYNGIDATAFSPGKGQCMRKKLDIAENVFLIGTVSRLDPVKDHATLLQAFRKIRKTHQNCMLLIVGDGPERSTLESLAGDGVLFLGNCANVAEIMQGLDIFVLSSLNEGISNTILEAMATGLPVIATSVGGNPELVVENCTGTLFPPGNANALTSAIQNYMQDMELCKTHGDNGRTVAVEKFSIAHMVASYESVWKRVFHS